MRTQLILLFLVISKLGSAQTPELFSIINSSPKVVFENFGDSLSEIEVVNYGSDSSINRQIVFQRISPTEYMKVEKLSLGKHKDTSIYAYDGKGRLLYHRHLDRVEEWSYNDSSNVIYIYHTITSIGGDTRLKHPMQINHVQYWSEGRIDSIVSYVSTDITWIEKTFYSYSADGGHIRVEYVWVDLVYNRREELVDYREVQKVRCKYDKEGRLVFFRNSRSHSRRIKFNKQGMISYDSGGNKRPTRYYYDSTTLSQITMGRLWWKDTYSVILR